jgi:O-antigen ligase
MSAIAAAPWIRRPDTPVIGGGIAAGILIGILVAWNPLAGVAIVFALVYAPLAMTNLPLAMGLWLPLLFLEGLPGTTMLPEVGLAAIAAGWLGQALRHGSWQRRQLNQHKRTLLFACVFVLWLALSLAWALEPSRGVSLLASAVEVVLALVLVSTTPATAPQLRTLAAGFVAGALLSALIGIIGQSVGASTVEMEGRLQGAAGDPNFFAAQLVAGMALALGLIASTRRLPSRLLLTAILFPLAYGIIASESRGGFVALLATGLAALIIFRRQRMQILLVIVGIAAVMGIWLSTNTSAWHRITHASEDRGSGREDLWTVALRVYEDNPVVGVGLSNFEVYAPQYTREPGTLTGVVHIESELGVHNAYLSLLVETGLAGVFLFLFLAGRVVLTDLRGARQFELAADPDAAMLARATAVALVGMLSAAFFLSNAEDKRVWVLMGMALASAGVAQNARLTRGGRSPDEHPQAL